MSALGHKQTKRLVRVMSGLPPKADVLLRGWSVGCKTNRSETSGLIGTGLN